jgi:DNA-binding NarL/FixJ family response regulator
MSRIRVLLVDDQKLFVHSLRIVLESRTDDVEVVGVAYDGREAVEAVERTRPEVVLMDVRMPVMDGVEAARAVHERHPEVRVVMLTTYDDDHYVRDAMRHGAVGYLLKSIPPAELVASVRVARTGTIQISPEVAAKVLKESAQSLVQEEDRRLLPEDARELYASLTMREREVLALLTKAYDNRQIAEALSIADQTVKNHIHAIYDKLYVSSRMQLIQLMKGLGPTRS